MVKNSRSHKATVTLIMVYGTFFICWFPNFFILMFFQINPRLVMAFHSDYPKAFKCIYNIFLVILPPMNSTLNPFIYGFYHSTFRKSVARLFGRRTSSSNAHDVFIRNSSRSMKWNILCRYHPPHEQRITMTNELRETRV